MGLRCASCGFDNDPTRVYCHNCGLRLERGQAVEAPTGFMHPTDAARMKKPRQPLAWGRYIGAAFRLLLLAGMAAAVVLALRPPPDVPPPVAADAQLASRLNTLVGNAANASEARAFSIPAGDLNVWLNSMVSWRAGGGAVALQPQRVYAVAETGAVRMGLEARLPPGIPVYFEGLYAPQPVARGYTLVPRALSIGCLPLPWPASELVTRQFAGLADAGADLLDEMAKASEITITPEKVHLGWGGRQP